MSGDSVARDWGAFIAGARYEDLPDAIVAKTRRHILDTLGAALAGATAPEAVAVTALLAATEGSGRAAVWGHALRLSPRNAALVNGVAAHAFELDDTGGCDHSGAVVLPAALAALNLAERPVSGRELLLAVNLGYDLSRRVLEACGGYEPHNEAGWHSTGTCGTFGAAAAAARLLGLDGHQAASAIGMAASFSGGLWAFIHDGSPTKKLHAGRAAESGLLAALLARQGLSGPRAVFADVWGGFLKTYAPTTRTLEPLLEPLGERWRIDRVSIKPYASCRGTHSSVDALGILLERHGLNADNVVEVTVRLSPFLQGMCGGRDVASLAAAQMSLPYALAAHLVWGEAGLAAFEPARRFDPRISAALARIRLEVDPTIAANQHPEVRVTTAGGETHAHRVTDPLGSPTNPVSETGLRAKFDALAARVLPAAAAHTLADAVLNLDGISDVRGLETLLRAGDGTLRPWTEAKGADQ